MGGPIFILQAGKRVAEEGINHLLYYLALISANLAVVNFLPLPVLDGGAMLILMIEKVRGKGLSARATTIWQSVGLGLICALLLFVTYNDIMRWITGDM